MEPILCVDRKSTRRRHVQRNLKVAYLISAAAAGLQGAERARQAPGALVLVLPHAIVRRRVVVVVRVSQAILDEVPDVRGTSRPVQYSGSACHASVPVRLQCKARNNETAIK